MSNMSTFIRGLIGVLVILYFTRRLQQVQNSLLLQSIHYFARPSFGMISTPIQHPANWLGKDLPSREQDWKFILSVEDKEEVIAVTRAVVAKNIDLSETKKEDFKFSRLAARLRIWKEQLNPRHGIGIILIKGLPVTDLTPYEVRFMWWGLGLHLGLPGPQNSAGDLIGTVKDMFYNTTRPTLGSYGAVRQYMTADSIPFHCDVADVVGLLCLSQGATGGQSRVASSVAIYNILLQKHPELVQLLYESIPLDIRGENGVNYTYVTPVAAYDGILRTFWHTEYYLSPYRYADSPQSSVPASLQRLIETYDSIANSPDVYFDMEFEVGDAQLISNHVTVHGRTAYTDDDTHRRHLLRLWLSLDEDTHVMESVFRMVMRGKVMFSMLQSLITAKMRVMNI